MTKKNSLEDQAQGAVAEAAVAAEAPAKSRTLWSDAWQRLKRNRLALIGAAWIVFVILVAVTADLWAPQILGSPTAIDTATVAQNSKLPHSLEHPLDRKSVV